MRGKLKLSLRQFVACRIIPAHAGQTSPSGPHPRAAPDHPRACGANEASVAAASHLAGSSPRMRGKRDEFTGVLIQRRIIPAHAGQTPARLPVRYCKTDHPRACGANQPFRTERGAQHGSSPRMRGKLEFGFYGVLYCRIIPAHAGQTAEKLSDHLNETDHPRACGANVSALQLGADKRGLSPRMRGKPAVSNRAWRPTRIIPAHAGQTLRFIVSACPWTDHPRACGANSMTDDNKALMAGSSPRMRGKLVVVVLYRGEVRIIPAHAGQTSIVPPESQCSQDHPRACGANKWDIVDSLDPAGSSPCMRGKRYWKGRPSRHLRIIPAHAGQTAILLRSRVEKSGSSPRMRGKPADPERGAAPVRIIPAHAGQTCAPFLGFLVSTDHPRACGANPFSGERVHCGSGSSPRMRGKRQAR